MSQVAAVSGETGDDFDKLREKAREMGAKAKFSASEAADVTLRYEDEDGGTVGCYTRLDSFTSDMENAMLISQLVRRSFL